MIGGRGQEQRTRADHGLEIADSVRFNAFALPRQQADKNLVLQFLILILNFIAIIFESFLHINLGRDYVNPLNLFFGFLQHCLTSLADTIRLLIIALAGWAAFAYFGGYATSLDLIWGETYDFFRSGFVRWFFVAGLAAMTIQAVYSFLTYRKTKRFSYSNGTPWLFYLTRAPFFKTENYILYGEPLLVVLVGVGLFFAGWVEGKYLAFFGGLYLLRNLYVYSIMDKGNVQRNDMEIQSIIEDESHPAQAQPVQASIRSKPRSDNEPADFIE